MYPYTTQYLATERAKDLREQAAAARRAGEARRAAAACSRRSLARSAARYCVVYGYMTFLLGDRRAVCPSPLRFAVRPAPAHRPDALSPAGHES